MAHPDALIGPVEVLWLAGILPDTSGATLNRWRSSWRLSLNEILHCVDCEAELQRTRRICFELQKRRMLHVFQQGQDVHLRSFFQSAVVQGMHEELLQALDDVVTDIQNARSAADDYHSVFRLVCRVYASIADVLGYMAGEGGGIRAGPASNVAWGRAFALLDAAVKSHDLIPATKALAEERSKWINNGSDLLIRAARHYEKAAQMLTLILVDTCTKLMNLTKTATLPAIGQEVVATIPVRIDLAGGWSDTPPVCYEHGGRVATLAIRWKDEKPVKSIAKRIPELKIKVTWGDGLKNEFTELSHFSDHSKPSASAALLKCAFIVAGIVDYPSNVPLAKQLEKKLGSGVELTTIAKVPIGSGLGTSSILGASVLATLYRISGVQYDLSSLVHATLKVEQLLTSGGGWQDQCGGLYPGAKQSESPKSDQMRVTTRVIDVADGFLDKLEKHLHLVYTGRTRLAKNLLQDVLRRWHSRESTVVQAINDLVSNAAEAEEALKTGDLAKLGSCLERYRGQKLVMAPGSVPPVVGRLIEEIRDGIYGCCLTGAGGGGFLIVLAKEEGFEEKLQRVIETVPDLKQFKVYPTLVDMEGLTVC